MHKNNYIDIAEYLLQIKPTIDISVFEEIIFRDACFYGDINLLNWLITKKTDINISAHDEEAFRNACSNGNIKIIKSFQK